MATDFDTTERVEACVLLRGAQKTMLKGPKDRYGASSNSEFIYTIDSGESGPSASSGQPARAGRRSEVTQPLQCSKTIWA
jgi:hypothetical protein